MVFAQASEDGDDDNGALRKPFVQRLQLHDKPMQVRGLKWSYDNHELASGDNDHRPFVLNQHSTQPVLKYCEQTPAMKAIAWCPHLNEPLAFGRGTAERSTNSHLSCMDTGSQGFLILGERRTGNSSLELDIAARARMPIFNIKDQELKAGLWVLQRESKALDLVAGGQQNIIHTQYQDHEAFINQLLVELDGFAKHDGVVRMATTGNLNQFDNALQQPGRMDRVAEKSTVLRPLELKLAPVLLEGSAFRSKFLDAYDELMSDTSWFATFSAIIPEGVWKTKILKKLSKMLVNNLELTPTTEELQSVVDLMEPYGQISNSTALCMGNNHKYDADEFMSYSSCFTTLSTMTPERVRKIKMLVNHLGLTLPNEDLQSVVILCKFLVATQIDDSPAKSHFNDLIGNASTVYVFMRILYIRIIYLFRRAL